MATANQKTIVALEKVKAALAKGKKLAPSCRSAGISTTTFYRHVPEYKANKEGFVVDRASDDLPQTANKKRTRRTKQEMLNAGIREDYVRRLEHFIASKLVEIMQ